MKSFALTAALFAVLALPAAAQTEQQPAAQATTTQTQTTQYAASPAAQPMGSVTTTTTVTTGAAAGTPATAVPPAASTETTTTATVAAPPAVPAAPAGPRVKLATSMGDIVIELNKTLAPKSTANFLQYVKAGHYKGTVFHRVIDGFMIQGGGYDKDLKQKPTKGTLVNEAKNGLKNDKYTIAMARPADPHGATSQFFINVENNNKLDFPGRDGWGYAVFGKVVEGTDVVDRIKAVPVAPKGEHQHAPVTPIVVTSATVLK